jgi:hypothetical protein
LLYCWYNDAGDERSKSLGDSSMTDAEGWLRVADLKLNVHVGKPDLNDAKFGQVCQSWLDYGKTKTGEPKEVSTMTTEKHNAEAYLSHFANRVAKDVEPLEVQQWLDKQSYGIRSKLRNMMSAIYAHGQKFGLMPRGEEFNPMPLVSAPVVSQYEAVSLSGAEAAAVIKQLADPLVRTMGHSHCHHGDENFRSCRSDVG